MTLKLPGSRKAARKQNASGEMRTPQIVGITTKGPWWPLFRHSSILSSFHGYGDLGLSTGVKYTWLGSKQRQKGPKPVKHRKEPYPSVKQERSINYNIKYTIPPKNGTKWLQNGVYLKDLSNSPMLKPLLVLKQMLEKTNKGRSI